MNARMINRIEAGVEQAAAALLGGSAGYAVYRLSSGGGQRLACAVAAFFLAYMLCLVGMKAANGSNKRFDIRIFDVRSLNISEPDELLLTERLGNELVLEESDRLGAELVLTDADRLPAGRRGVGEPLVLDDVLAAVGADSRVVRLFDRKAMPTPGQLSSSIERHLDRGGASAHPDAAQALSDALAELRRSLR